MAELVSVPGGRTADTSMFFHTLQGVERTGRVHRQTHLG